MSDETTPTVDDRSHDPFAPTQDAPAPDDTGEQDVKSRRARKSAGDT